MGLDMWFWGNKTVSSSTFNTETGTIETKQEFSDLLNSLNVPDTQVNSHFSWIRIQIPLITWRKANAIHGWFVQNCQDGIDDCRYAYVSQEQLQELIDLIKEALANKDSSSIKPTEGFFFGSSEIDDEYWDDLQKTLDTLEPLISEYEGFTYSSSW